ncbi:MAG TPA: PQQ-dependent sugar dehydrogenase [Candidatus Acidoferrum sp.]|nr:PQQ-dependent sugar dehydrogenase [Candidatus Acidoferrum sp.]
MTKLSLSKLSGLMLGCAFSCGIALAQPPTSPKLGAGPWVVETYEEPYVKVSVLARGLDHPFGLAMLPGTVTGDNAFGDALISERSGKIKYYKHGQVQAEIVADLTKTFPLEQLFDLKLHPQYDKNHLIYFTYIKTAPRPDGSKGYYANTALGRGRFDGTHLVDIKEIYEAKAWSQNIGGASSRLHFLKDGTLLFGVSHRIDTSAPQKLDSDIGKILRLNDDGSVPKDNPFIGKEGARREIYSWGHRSVMDFAENPVTHEVWEIENGPQGGDEVNVLKPGVNYGWPIATYGRDYDGQRFSPQPWVEGTQLPEVYWVPSVTVAGMTFYTGSKFAKWKNNLFVTSMIVGRIPGTGHVERVVFNDKGEIRRESFLKELHQRIRYVQQGPDELVYLLTDEADGAFLKLEPTTKQEFMTVNGIAAVNPTVVENTDKDAINDSAAFANLDCKACHRSNIKAVGPAYIDIAKRYPLTDANVNQLAAKVIKGGEGAWGDTPMLPHADMKPAQAQQLVRAILQAK